MLCYVLMEDADPDQGGKIDQKMRHKSGENLKRKIEILTGRFKFKIYFLKSNPANLPS